MDVLTIDKNSFLANGHKLILKGVSIPDPLRLLIKEQMAPLDAIALAKKIGANCVRIPILPGNFLAIPKFLEKHIDPIVDFTERQKLYVILDWHAIGNPLYGQTRLKESFHKKDGKKTYKYESSYVLAKEGLQALASRYGKKPHVIFELYNEPIPGEKDIPEMELFALPWVKWKLMLSELVKIIRRKTPNVLLLSPTKWAYNLKLVSEDPITGDNLAHTAHIYPLSRHSTWKSMLECAYKLPIIITEWGYDSDNPHHTYYGNADTYAKPLLKYCQEHKISWVAWCLSKSWRPRMLKQWAPLELSEFGKLVKDNL